MYIRLMMTSFKMVALSVKIFFRSKHFSRYFSRFDSLCQLVISSPPLAVGFSKQHNPGRVEKNMLYLTETGTKYLTETKTEDSSNLFLITVNENLLYLKI